MMQLLLRSCWTIIYRYRLLGGAKGRTERSTNIFLNTNKLLHALLGETYTINPHVPAFQLAAILQEFPLAQQADDESGENTSEEKKAALKEVPHLFLRTFLGVH